MEQSQWFCSIFCPWALAIFTFLTIARVFPRKYLTIVRSHLSEFLRRIATSRPKNLAGTTLAVFSASSSWMVVSCNLLMPALVIQNLLR